MVGAARSRRSEGVRAISHFVLQYRRTGRGAKRAYKTLRPRLAKSTTRVRFRKGKIGETYLFRITAVGTGGAGGTRRVFVARWWARMTVESTDTCQSRSAAASASATRRA